MVRWIWLVAAGCGRIGFDAAVVDDATGDDAARPCVSGEIVSPVGAFDASLGPPGSACMTGNALALDGMMVGLDRVASDTCQGMWDPGNGSCGCVAIDLGREQAVGLVEVWAAPVPQACNDPCGAGLCGTGDTMSLLVGTTPGTYELVTEIPLGTSLARYPFNVPGTINTARYVVVCRQGQSSDRDDITIDFIQATCR